MQIIDALWFVAIFAGSALVIFAKADWRLGCPLALWILAYVTALAYFVPRIRRRAEQIAHMRAIVTGRIVDSYTNIQTVKLFAHLEREDAHAREALVAHTATFQNETRLITVMNTSVSVLNSVLIVTTGALAVWLWTKAAVTLGDIALASGLAIRIATMSGWIMWVSIGIFENIGTVQEGMRTIARPHALIDRPKAVPLAEPRGAIGFEISGSITARAPAYSTTCRSQSRPARRSDWSGARAPASRPSPVSCCASTTWKAAAS